MNRERLYLSLLFGLLFLALTAYAEVAEGQVADTPELLVLRFDESAASLDQVSIRAAIAQELAMTLADDGSDQAATLIVSMTANGEVQLTYRPAREILTRSIPVTSTSNVPQLLAHLAGNLVRNEAGSLIAELQPPPPPPVASAPSATPTTDEPARATAITAPAQVADAPPFLAEAWIFSALFSFQLAGDEQVQLTVQQSKRFGRFEVGFGMRAAYGRTDATTQPLNEDFDTADARVSAYQVTFPISAEYRILGGEDAYLQLGLAAGFRLAGYMNQSESVASGTNGDFTLASQMTIGFRLIDNHGLVLRWVNDFLPTAHVIGSDEIHAVKPFRTGYQIGWQMGW